MKDYNRASALLAGAVLSARQGLFEQACSMIMEASAHPSCNDFVDMVRASALISRQNAAGAELRMDGPNLGEGLREVQEGASETAAGAELREVVDTNGDGRTVQTGAGAELREEVTSPKKDRTVQTGAGEDCREVVDDNGKDRSIQTGAGEENREVVDDAGESRTVQHGSVHGIDDALEYMGLLARKHCQNYADSHAEFHRNDPYRLVGSAKEEPAATKSPESASVKEVQAASVEQKVAPAAPVRETSTIRFTKALRNAAAHRRVEDTASKS